MLNIYWAEQSEGDLPLDDDWLSAGESNRLRSMRFARRRMDWRLGRWTAKRALAELMGLPGDSDFLSRIDIRALPSGAPEVLYKHAPAPVSISISHRGGLAACAVALSRLQLGCDLEVVEPRADAFVADYFTADEQTTITGIENAERDRLLALFWSAKESGLKALGEGLRRDTRDVWVSLRGLQEREGNLTSLTAYLAPAPKTWAPLQVHCKDGPVFLGWWQQTGNRVRTLVATFLSAAPIELRLPRAANHGALTSV